MTLEELLNKLIEKGWKPMWIEKEDIETIDYDKKRKKISIWYMNWETPSKWDFDWLFLDLRQLTAKESWLWQFVCENKLIVPDHMKQYNWYGYWLCECALLDEDKLEDFILSNIKVDE